MKDIDARDVWVLLRSCSPNDIPYAGKIELYEDIFVSTGHSMIGMSVSFASSEIISQLIIEDQARLIHPMMAPNHYR